MPTVLQVGGVRVVIFTNDHRPAHVHCFVGDAEVVVELEPAVRERARRGPVTAREGRRVLDLVGQHRGFLLKEWRRLHP